MTFKEFLQTADKTHTFDVTSSEGISFKNINNKKFVYPLVDLERCLQSLWIHSDVLKDVLDNNWEYNEKNYRAALKKVFAQETNNSVVSNSGSQTQSTVKCLQLYAYYLLNKIPNIGQIDADILSDDNLDVLFYGGDLSSDFTAWLKDIKGLTAPSIIDYSKAVEGTLSQAAKKTLFRISSPELFQKLQKAIFEDPIFIRENTGNIQSLRDACKYYVEFLNQKSTIDTLKFTRTCEAAGLKFSTLVATRFVAALLAKPFVILTGLSGSGKTKLAQAFVRWISRPLPQNETAFKVGDEIQISRSTYKVLDVDRLGLKINQGGQDSITFLPFDLIDSWCEVIAEKAFTDSTPSQTIQQAVLEKGIQYSPTLNSFHSPLKALAFWKRLKATSDSVAQYRLVPVGADWTNNEHLLGYANALNEAEYVMPDTGVLELMLNARDNPTKPFFLILDEMNLSHVERYFADFLSAMESKETIHLYKGTARQANGKDIPQEIEVPKNLFVIGTVNIDETTYMFSPKVLDRAQVIEFRVNADEMNSFLEASPDHEIDFTLLDGKGASMAAGFLNTAMGKCPEQSDAAVVLKAFFDPLSKIGAEFGYRTAKDFMKFVGHYMNIAPDPQLDNALDFAIMQKLLPKLHGATALRPVLVKLLELCGEKYPVSKAKLDRMSTQLKDNGYASFAEA